LNIKKKIYFLVDDCKTNWRSLRDGMRYRVKVQKNTKLGSSTADVECLDEEALTRDNLDWEFAHCMSFINTLSTKKTTVKKK